MDVGWGGVPRMSPSDTAIKYMIGNVKVKNEEDLPAGGHLRARRTMEGELRGHKFVKLDLLESYEEFYLQKKRLSRDAKPNTCSGVTRSPLVSHKPGAGLGWTEPRCKTKHLLRGHTLPTSQPQAGCWSGMDG